MAFKTMVMSLTTSGVIPVLSGNTEFNLCHLLCVMMCLIFIIKQDGVVLQKYACNGWRDAITTNYNRELERSVL